MSRRTRNLATDEVDYIEAAFSGVGSLGTHVFVLPEVTNPMVQAALVGGGAAVGGALANTLEGTPMGYSTSVDVQNVTATMLATAPMYYFGINKVASILGDRDVASFVIGLLGNLAGQLIPTIPFVDKLLQNN